MCIADQLATLFITSFGAYCYQTMPFGLKNACATFQRCMRRVFGELIGCIIEAYVDNIIVKSKKIGDLVPDLTEVFLKLRQHGVKLKPEKCVFGVPRGMLIGFVVSERVTEPPKIVPYYRLSRSTWPLSNNKELFCRFRRVKPDKSHTTGSLICAKPTRRRDQSTTLHYIKDSQV
jgi:hypothetical protein